MSLFLKNHVNIVHLPGGLQSWLCNTAEFLHVVFLLLLPSKTKMKKAKGKSAIHPFVNAEKRNLRSNFLKRLTSNFVFSAYVQYKKLMNIYFS